MFTAKTIIITGGSSGVGEKLAHRLVRRGARLALVARDEKKRLVYSRFVNGTFMRISIP